MRAAGRNSPRLIGESISIRFLPILSVKGSVLVSGSRGGRAVHAATFIRRREIVLEDELRLDPDEMSRILTHELCHFAWVRLGNAKRQAWECLLAQEAKTRAPGELGWSSEVRKKALRRGDRTTRSRRWRDYACESFCDTGAWLFAGLRCHPEFSLPVSFRSARRRWFAQHGLFESLSV